MKLLLAVSFSMKNCMLNQVPWSKWVHKLRHLKTFSSATIRYFGLYFHNPQCTKCLRTLTMIRVTSGRARWNKGIRARLKIFSMYKLLYIQRTTRRIVLGQLKTGRNEWWRFTIVKKFVFHKNSRFQMAVLNSAADISKLLENLCNILSLNVFSQQIPNKLRFLTYFLRRPNFEDTLPIALAVSFLNAVL